MSAQFTPSNNGALLHNDSYYDGQFSLSEQATPSKKKIDIKTPKEGIKFMVAILSLENSLLKQQLKQSDKTIFFKGLHMISIEKGGGKYGEETVERLTQDMKFYQQKTVELQLEVSRLKNADWNAGKPGPIPPKEKNTVMQSIHDISITKENNSKRNQSFYSKKVFAVRNRSLMFHSLILWLDMSRIINIDNDEVEILKSLVFAKWRLKSRFKVGLYLLCRLLWMKSTQVSLPKYLLKSGKDKRNL